MTASRDYSEWYGHGYPRMAAAVSAFVGDRDVAHEAVSEAYVRAWQNWSKLAVAENADGWVYRTACNHARRRARRLSLERSLLGLLGSSTDRASPAHDDRTALWDVVARLSTRQRQVITLKYGLDLTDAEVADLLGVARGTVSATVHAARAALRS